MHDGRGGWIGATARMVDDRMRDINRSLKRSFRMLRLAQVALIVGLLASYAFAVLAIVYPQYAGYFYAGAILLLSTALIPWIALISLPLKLRSIRRLVDKGYPANAREMAIRVVAKKLHDESIETEEMLFDTAINESRKAYRKFKAKQAADAAREAQEAADRAAARAATAARESRDDLQPRP